MTAITAHLDVDTSAAPTTPEWPRTLLWMTPLVAATILSKLAVPPLGEQGLGITLPLLLVTALAGCILQQFSIDTGRFAFGLVTLSLLALVQVVKNDVFSLTSLLLLAVLHMPMLLRFREPPLDMQRVIGFFLALCTLCACCSIVQFALQPWIDSRWLFPVDNFVPDTFLIQNFNNQAPLEYGSTALRANGVFMMEPSFLSQLLAVGIVTELATRNRWWRLTLFALAILASYSGTGLMVLALCLPVIVITQRRWGLIAALAVLAVLILFVTQIYGHSLGRQLNEHLRLDTLTARINEFDATGSSGFARFVGGFYLFEQFLWDHPLHALLGVGAGMFKEYAPLSHYPVAEMPLFKMVLEFGICGALLYFSFLFFCLSSPAIPRVIALAVGATFFLNGLYVPFAHALALSLLVWTGTRHTRPDPHAEIEQSAVEAT